MRRVASAFEHLEHAVEVEFRALIRKSKNAIARPNDTVDEVRDQVARLERMRDKSARVLADIRSLLPSMFDPAIVQECARRKQKIIALLKGGLLDADVELDVDVLDELAGRIGDDGSGSMALAMYLSMAITEAAVAAPLTQQAREAFPAYRLLGASAEGDVMAVAFLVLMEASKSAHEDLTTIMAGVKAINAAREVLRELKCKIDCDVSTNIRRAEQRLDLDLSNGLGNERAYHHVSIPHLDAEAPGGFRLVEADLHPGNIVQIADLGTALAVIKGKLDCLHEMGEMESLRLQMAMDRLSKLMATLSNLLKKISETAQAITQNIK